MRGTSESFQRWRLHFPFPDVKFTTIDGMSFASGILNIVPRDALSLAVVRADKDIRSYARRVREVIARAANEIDRERTRLAAMREARGRSAALRKIENVIEATTLVASPITYLPVAGNVVSMATTQHRWGAWRPVRRQRC
jgi:hypothetical protein